VLVSSSAPPLVADDAHRLDLALEAWRGFDRPRQQSSANSVDKRRGASDCTHGSSEDQTSLASSIDAALAVL